MPKRIVSSLIFAALLLACIAACGTEAPERPNILFLSVDDMNDWVGALGYESAETPNIDRLANRGVLFTNAHTPSPKCNPARTAILSGLRPSTTGVYANSEWWKPNFPDMVTMPRYFKDNGYYAAGGGKVFHHTPGFNPPESWDEYSDLVFDLKTEGFLIPYRRPDNISSFDWGPLDVSAMEMGDGTTVRWATEFLEREHEQPFFLAVGLFQPHLPFYSPRAIYDQVSEADAPLPPVNPDDLNDIPEPGLEMAAFSRKDLESIEAHDDLGNVIRAYVASIRHADTLIGRVLDALDASPYAGNTIIAFWSDHGFHFGEKRHWAKNTLWERSTRVPLAIIAPGVTEPGSRSTRPVSLLDLFPTLVDLTGLPPREDLEGVSLRPLLDDPSAEWERPAVITFGRGNHSARSERYRYIRYANGDEEFYDHKDDPHEWTNLAGKPESQDEMARLSKWLPTVNAPNALRKGAFRFDPESYTWEPRESEAP